MNAEVQDILGNVLAIGDEVAVAFPSGNSATLRVGKIIGLTEKETQRWNYSLQAYFPGPPSVSVEVEWDKAKSGGFLPSKKATKIESTSGRFIKLK
jgi:hypothetical protein